MTHRIGNQAIVIGAGLAGLTAAQALAEHFERVVVLERDTLPPEARNRAGVPQGRHVHALLAGGARALGELFPGFAEDLAAAGAVRLRVGLDIRVERPGYDPFPQRDLGFFVHAMSRAAVEHVVRRRATGCRNIVVEEQCRVEALTVRPDGSRVTGVRRVSGDGRRDTLEADLVIDASGRGDLTLDLLDALGRPRPAETTIGVDLAYASAVVRIPDDAPSDWKGVFTFPDPATRSSRGSLMLPLEEGRWIVTVAGRHGDDPPGDADGFMAYTRALRTPTISNAIERAERTEPIARFRFPESVYRHYEGVDAFPAGLLPVGDAVCRFNPVYGQGMSVAAQEAVALSRLLGELAGDADPLARLPGRFFAEAAALIETPWTGAAIPDFIHPATRGKRPDDFDAFIRFGAALTRLAARDPAVHKLTAEVQHLLRSRRVYQDPALVERVLAVMQGDRG
jgi:2-polyprenyl-6-methoxyphenol hydroxylase-like FAD-dependent oxidoreductase